MTLLLSAGSLEARAVVAAGPLACLAGSLAADLDVVIAHGVEPPAGKARLSRTGGRCAHDGELLAFDPYSLLRHTCVRCRREYEGDDHNAWWLMGYQLWLAERVLHAAALQSVGVGGADVADRYAAFARDSIDAISALYHRYPNRDNVLGPSRPFFSTYLESIWLLQLVIAADLLEAGGRAGTSIAAFRDRVVAPSLALIDSYDEGKSNRQVWNVAAMSAADRLLGRDPTSRVLAFLARLEQSLLPDGTWYEGENYHLFAHRGLWYIVALAEATGIELPREFLRRFDEGFATPFLTALPDFTFPSRRDSQYAVSLRQWRFAELCELGLARTPGDGRLRTALDRLYAPDIPRGDTGRARSTADAERNSPAVALDRSELGWRALLFALPDLPPSIKASAPRSVLLQGQGLGVLRRDAGQVYVALDYGETGGGHGHPDRLGMLFAHRQARWLDDPGTGSYTDPSLFWYRSTLAHNAPLFDGHSQARAPGTLEAFEDRGGAGWISARADGIWPGVSVRRTLVVMDSYLLDMLDWTADHEVTCELPIHADGELSGVGEWVVDDSESGPVPEDGFAFLSDRETAPGGDEARFKASVGDSNVDAWFSGAPTPRWWRAVAPGAPGSSPRRFLVRTQRSRAGMLAAVWSWGRAVQSVDARDGAYRIELASGERHTHARSDLGWHVDLETGAARSSIDLGGLRARHVPRIERQSEPMPLAAPVRPLPRIPASECQPFLDFRADPGATALVLRLGERHYRRSELTWSEAGRPAATITLAASGDQLLVDVEVAKPEVYFAPPRDGNPLDNEHADINSDGLQIFLVVNRPEVTKSFAWLIVPESGAATARVTPLVPGSERVPPDVRWRITARGWCARLALPVGAAGVRTGARFAFDCIVNDMSADRQRRRGQLVPSGAAGEFVYLHGDRQSPDRHLQFAWPHV